MTLKLHQLAPIIAHKAATQAQYIQQVAQSGEFSLGEGLVIGRAANQFKTDLTNAINDADGFTVQDRKYFRARQNTGDMWLLEFATNNLTAYG